MASHSPSVFHPYIKVKENYFYFGFMLVVMCLHGKDMTFPLVHVSYEGSKYRQEEGNMDGKKVAKRFSQWHSSSVSFGKNRREGKEWENISQFNVWSGWVGSHCLHVMELKSILEKLIFFSNICFKVCLTNKVLKFKLPAIFHFLQRNNWKENSTFFFHSKEIKSREMFSALFL